MNANLEIFLDGSWQLVGVFCPDLSGLERGIAGGGVFEYDIDYTVARLDNLPHWRVGLAFNVSFELFRSTRWPSFLLDIIPSGAGRRIWLRRLGLEEGPRADWELLRHAAGNPPGNLRVTGAAVLPGTRHPGFTQQEVIDKNADFIEYAEGCGAVVAGATDVQGDAPKFLLVRDAAGRWHPDGALPEKDVADCWIVKFPRGRTDTDRTVLRNEAPYLEVARAFGLRVGQPLIWSEDALFIPRFDRCPSTAGLQRYGLESLCSAAGIAEFGRRADHAVFCLAIAAFATDPPNELIEYLRRDILNAALRNTDNHGRNSAFLKTGDGIVALSPLYDFAPMFLDPEGIPRSSRWEGDLEPQIGRPDWGRVADALGAWIDPALLRVVFASDAEKIERLPETMGGCGVEDGVINQVARRCAEIAADLRQAGREG